MQVLVMRVAIISYFFPPCATGAATVMYNLCKALPKEDFTVITAADVFATNMGIRDDAYTIDCQVKRLQVHSNSMFSRFSFFLQAVLAVLILNEKKKVQGILAVYPHFTDLLAGYVASRLTRKPLAVYMHDLFSEVRKNALAYRLWLSIETRILQSADVVLVMNEKYVEHYKKRGIRNFAMLPPSIEVIERPSDMARSEAATTKDGGLTITYTGSVDKAHETAVITFLKAAKKVKGIKVTFATPSRSVSPELKTLLEEVNVGFVPRKKSLQLQRDADILYLPLASGSPYPEELECAIPCKLLEYLVAGKPVLAMVPQGSFMDLFVRKHKIGISVTDHSADRVVNAIETLKDEEKRREYGRNALKTATLFDSKEQSKRLLLALQKIIFQDQGQRKK